MFFKVISTSTFRIRKFKADYQGRKLQKIMIVTKGALPKWKKSKVKYKFSEKLISATQLYKKIKSNYDLKSLLRAFVKKLSAIYAF